MTALPNRSASVPSICTSASTTPLSRQNWEDLLETIIEDQEGGWKLEHVAGDNDGGWTFGGMTRKEYEEHFSCKMDKAAMAQYITSDRSSAINSCLIIYTAKYITPCENLGLVLPQCLCGPFLSCAINCSNTPKEAIQLLQRALHIEDDGIIGPKTKAQLAKFYTVDAVRGLLAGFFQEWLDHYDAICAHDPSKEKFHRGWKNRVAYWQQRCKI